MSFSRMTALVFTLALMAGGATPSAITPEPLRTEQAIAAPNMEVLAEDYAKVVLGTAAERDHALCVMRMWGATHVRILIYEERVRQFGFERYDEAVNRAANIPGEGNRRPQGCFLPWKFEVQLVLTGVGKRWEIGEYGSFAEKVSRRFEGRTGRYSLYNEPNSEYFLLADKDKSSVETYRRLVWEGWRAIQAEDPAAEILVGELWNAGPAMDFLRDLLAGPLPPVDGLALHPYTRRHPRYRQTRSERIEMGTLWQVNTLVREAFAAGRFRTPQNERPPIFLTEFAVWSRSRREMREKNIPNPYERADRVRAAWRRACRTPHVVQMSQYMFFPALPDWEGEWDTSIIKPSGRPDSVFLDIAEWFREKPECVETEIDLPLPSKIDPATAELGRQP